MAHLFRIRVPCLDRAHREAYCVAVSGGHIDVLEFLASEHAEFPKHAGVCTALGPRGRCRACAVEVQALRLRSGARRARRVRAGAMAHADLPPPKAGICALAASMEDIEDTRRGTSAHDSRPRGSRTGTSWRGPWPTAPRTIRRRSRRCSGWHERSRASGAGSRTRLMASTASFATGSAWGPRARPSMPESAFVRMRSE